MSHYPSTKTPPPKDFLWQHPYHFLALGFGTGLMPCVPGTVGTVPGVALAYGLTLLPWFWALMVLGALTIWGVLICAKTSKMLGEEDPSVIVWDEIIGYAWGMLWFPWEWSTALAVFVLFRFFDILKPWPISVADASIHGGLGIMLDDFLAAGFAAATIGVLLYGLPGYF